MQERSPFWMHLSVDTGVGTGPEHRVFRRQQSAARKFWDDFKGQPFSSRLSQAEIAEAGKTKRVAAREKLRASLLNLVDAALHERCSLVDSLVALFPTGPTKKSKSKSKGDAVSKKDGKRRNREDQDGGGDGSGAADSGDAKKTKVKPLRGEGPMRPRTALHCFTLAQKKDGSNWVERWKEMDVASKQVWFAAAAEDRKRYEREMEEWETLNGKVEDASVESVSSARAVIKPDSYEHKLEEMLSKSDLVSQDVKAMLLNVVRSGYTDVRGRFVLSEGPGNERCVVEVCSDDEGEVKLKVLREKV